MQKQLSISDTLEPLDTAVIDIKSGDWVRLTRKTPHAAYWKKGEIVQIEGVHPVNGSVRFWNERANTWAYLHPGDMVQVPAPIELKPVQPIAPGEGSTPALDGTESNPIAVGTESNQPIAVGTESKAVSVEIDSVSGVDTGTESKAVSVEIDSVPEVPIAVGTESETEPEAIDSVPSPVNRYRPKGTARGGEYYRYSYRDGVKRKNVHIPGGNTGSIIAKERAAEVLELSAAGVSPTEICDRIRAWSKRITC